MCALDANSDALTWNFENPLPPNHSNVKLKPLINDLFDRILPQGVSQLVMVPTHAQQGIATKCLDHLYTNQPAKLSDVQAEFTGMSDHKIIKVNRYSKSLKEQPRYVRKRMFKNFNKEEFKKEVSKMPELAAISNCQCANQAAIFLRTGLSRILDICAPIKTIQTKQNYAPHLQEVTKQLMEERNRVQQNAAETGSQDDWRDYRRLRNRCVAAQRMDRKKWEEAKLRSKENSPSNLWKSVKGIIGWNNTGPPTKLFH